MAEIEKSTIKLIRSFIIPNILEALTVIVVFLLLPTDPKNAWLLGYSKSRIFIIGGFFLYILALIYVFFSLSSPPKKFSSILQKLKANLSINYYIEIICGVCFLLIYACGFYFFNIIPTDQAIEAIHIHLIPLVAYFTVFNIQLFVFLILFRCILGGERLSLKDIWLNATLPIIREKIFTKVDAFITFGAENLNKSFLTVMFILTPVLLTTVFIWMFFTATIFDFIPAYTDEVGYWHETLTFVEHGFAGGQYSIGENPAPAEFTRFGVHGPAYPVLYGLLGRITGWEYSSGIVINLILTTLALIFLLRTGNPGKKQLLAGIILLGTYWPLLFYLPSNMTESLNQAIAMVLSVLFFRQISNQENNWKLNIVIFSIILLSIPLRVTWSLLFFHFFFFMIFDYRRYKVWGAIVISVGGVLFAFFITKYLYAPFPMVFRFLLDEQLSLQELISVAIHQVLINLGNLVDEVDTPLFIQAFRYVMLGACIYLVYKLIRFVSRESQPIQNLLRTELSFHFLNLVVPFTGVVVLFQVVDTRDYRNLSVSFFLSALVLLLFSRYRYIYAIILINGLLVFSFIPGYIHKRSNNFIYNEYEIKTTSNSVSEYMKFDETQSNRWCNTLGYLGKLNVRFVGVDAGIGLSQLGTVSKDTKTKYLLLEEDFIEEHKDILADLGLQRLWKTTWGILYNNPNSDCE